MPKNPSPKACVSTFICLLLVNISCISTRKATYFNELGETAIMEKTPIPIAQIQKNDLLSISVSSLNADASQVFNAANIPSSQLQLDEKYSGYLVNPEGFIKFPILGNIKAENLSKDDLAAAISQALLEKELLKDPVVTVRILSFHVTVLGEVKNPATLSIPTEKVSMLEALGMAGDLTIYGERSNVLLIREVNGEKLTKRIDLNTNELLSSPYYYLQSNDVIYVSPNKAKVSSASRGQQWIPVFLSSLSLGIIIVDRVFR